METFTCIAAPEDAGLRADKWLAAQMENMTRSSLEKLFEQGNVCKNGRQIAKNERLRAGDEVCVTLPEPQQLDIQAQNIPLDIVYEDADLLVVNKPKGMVVHPAPGNWQNTLVNALMYHCKGSLSGINGVIRPGIVHRIDKDTSGLLIVAKNDKAHLSLAEQIKAHSFTRLYEAVVYGNVKQEEGCINAPIGRHKTDRKKMAVTAQNSKEAITHYTVLNRFAGYTHVRLRLETGRTHQIRVHMAYIGHPVCGDPVYGPKKCIASLGGQCLHARVIGFVHPTTGQYMEFQSDLPAYFTQFLQSIQ